MAKSAVVLDIAPWEEETDMTKLEANVRGITKEGLTWGDSKLIPVIGKINKLQIVLVVVDDKVSVDELAEQISTENEDLVQSVDIVSFVKI